MSDRVSLMLGRDQPAFRPGSSRGSRCNHQRPGIATRGSRGRSGHAVPRPGIMEQETMNNPDAGRLWGDDQDLIAADPARPARCAANPKPAFLLVQDLELLNGVARGDHSPD